jgi:hypothetical protein
MSIPRIEIVADLEGLWVDLGVAGKHKFVPLSPVEFMQSDAPAEGASALPRSASRILRVATPKLLSNSTRVFWDQRRWRTSSRETDFSWPLHQNCEQAT